ncbi:MAG: AAA family ATPase [Lysobacterales bacterium]
MVESGPRIVILAGPNGAGKSTFARQFLPHEAASPAFVNADLIAAGISPFEPQKASIRAGRLMLQEIARHIAARESFGFETTLAGKGYAKLIPEWRTLGFSVHLIYLRLPSVQAAIDRVAARVAQGGHDIPQQVIARRFHAGWRNFGQVYSPLVDTWRVFENSGPLPVLMTHGART